MLHYTCTDSTLWLASFAWLCAPDSAQHKKIGTITTLQISSFFRRLPRGRSLWRMSLVRPWWCKKREEERGGSVAHGWRSGWVQCATLEHARRRRIGLSRATRRARVVVVRKRFPFFTEDVCDDSLAERPTLLNESAPVNPTASLSRKGPPEQPTGSQGEAPTLDPLALVARLQGLGMQHDLITQSIARVSFPVWRRIPTNEKMLAKSEESIRYSKNLKRT